MSSLLSSSSLSSLSPCAIPIPCYLQLFPDETLEHIIRYLSPLDFPADQYLSRQETLRSLCLTSKRLRVIAQPFLFEIVKFDHAARARQVEGVNEAMWIGLRKLTVRQGTLTLLQKIAPKASKLEELSIYKVPSRLNHFIGSGIRKLHLNDLTLRARNVFDFPQLEQLSFVKVFIPNLKDFDFRLPSLRHLQFSPDKTSYFGNDARFIDAQVEKLVSFRGDASCYGRYPSDLYRPRKLARSFRYHISEVPNYFGLPLTTSIDHLQIEIHDTFGRCLNRDVEQVTSWKEFCERMPRWFGSKTLTFPSTFSETSDCQYPVELRQVIKELIQVCSANGSEIMFDAQNSTQDPVLSQGFVEWAERRKLRIEMEESTGI